MKKIAIIIMSSLTLQALTLSDAIELGLKNNPDFLIQQNRVLLSSEAKNIKQASNYGRFVLLGSYTVYNTPRTLAPITPPISPQITTSQDIASLGVAYDVTLFSGFSGVRDIEIASLSLESSKIALELSKGQLIYNIRSLYLKILSLKSQRDVALSYREALLELEKIVSLGVKVGKRARVDLLKTAADLESANAKVKELDSNIDILKSTLASVIGIEKVTDIEDIKTYSKTDLDESDIKSLGRYQLSLLQEKQSEKKLENTKSSYYPKLSANGYYGNNYGDGDSDDIWQVGIGLNWVLFDFGSRGAMVQKEKIEHLQSSLQTKKIALALTKDLEESKLRVDIAVAKLQSAKKELELVQESMEIEEMRYAQGVATIQDLLFAKNRYQNTLSKMINARYELQNTIYYYRYITQKEDKR